MTKIDLLKDPALELVVEIEPYSFSDRESPLMSPGQVSDDEFANYLADCLKDAGLDRLVPVTAGSMFYAIQQIDHDSLSQLVENEWSRWPEDEDYSVAENVIEYGSSFSGGIVVLDRGDCVSVPGCCCGLDCLTEWNQMIEEKPTEWTELWTGHDADSLELKFHQSEAAFEFRLGEWQSNVWDRTFTLSQRSFHGAIERLNQRAEKLTLMIEEVLVTRSIDQQCRSVVARRIAGVS